MAVDFAANYLNYFSRSASLISNTDPRPISCHIRIKPNANADRYVALNNNNAGGPRLLFYLYENGANTEMRSYNGGHVSSSSFSMSTTKFESFLWTTVDNGGADDHAWFREGVAIGTGSRTPDGDTENGCLIGSLTGTVSSWDINGDACEFAVWNAQLDVNDAAALESGVSADQIRPDKLVAYLPMLDNSGNDRILPAWTKNGTLLTVDHAPIIRRSSQILQFPVAGFIPSGGTYTPYYYHTLLTAGTL